ncbi:hypothetical protein D0Z07_1981 [Hyphodiscus hymeniophilus]|uniref:Uncharacterized protein n=1 Tax=Hyphodiscus hymeniophilus TaxID=353542 RepID=A0A9P6VQC1_9HELO|nr:hypothetical protein D0Z07_1981 [Hyphodiscus hymeniophilus]
MFMFITTFSAWLGSIFTTTLCQWLLFIIWNHRYIRLIVHYGSHWSYKTVPIPANPSFTSKDVTVIIPTIHNNFEELKESLQSILACEPYELLLVTTSDKYGKLIAFVKTLEASNIQIFQVPIANKRIQVCEAIPRVKTSFIVMADDDVTWPKTILPWLLAPLEDPKMGGVGPCQRVKRIRSGPLVPRIYNWLGAAYIERRNFEISATHGIDGGTSCMSGRTCAFRSEILQSPLFLEGFKTERWGKYQLNADDDNFVTRWLVSSQWKTWIQYNQECEIETTLENNIKFLYQCSRWARSNIRSNYTSMFVERHVWYQQPWSTYALHFATFTSLAFVVDPMILLLTYQATQQYSSAIQTYAVLGQMIWMLVTKYVKLHGLFIRNPSDLIFLPVSILFGYFHGLIKLYAAATLNMVSVTCCSRLQHLKANPSLQTSWGSRADGDADDEHRMSRRARRSESITLPRGNHPGLPRFIDDKTIHDEVSEKPNSNDEQFSSETDRGSESSYDVNDFDSSTSSPMVMVEEPHGR